MDPITLSLSPQQAALALIVVLTALVLGILMLMGRKGAIAPATGWLIPTAQALSVVMFGFATVAAIYMLWSVIAPPADTAAPAPGLGAGAVIVALLGAPFLIWRTVIAQKTVDFQKEGHITDRIAKAVEQLGAEKTVDRIGRPLTLFSGHATRETRFFPDGEPETLPPHSVEVSRQHTQQMVTRGVTSTMMQGIEVTFDHWPDTRTVIEWQGKPPPVVKGEHIAHTGDWQTFSESVPNIEVRIGGILSLERIAQDSTAYDQGRDHVPVMEILCAYIRENAPASSAQDHPYGEWEPLKDDATEEQRKTHEQARCERFGSYGAQGKVREWAQALPAPRQDIALALQVIGRRNAAQRRIEARWGEDAASDAEWPFDTPAPTLPEQGASQGEAAITTFKVELKAWLKRLTIYAGYSPDLRATNLQGAILSGLVFSGARLNGARMEGAMLFKARMEGASLNEARLEGAGPVGARLEGADLGGARMEGAVLFSARMEGANLNGARMEGTNLSGARMSGAGMHSARMESADLSGARMEGAELSKARMDGALLFRVRMGETTSMSAASLRGAALSGVNLAQVSISQAQVNQSFGDSSATLPDGITSPAHWPRYALDFFDLQTEWRKWQTDPAAYTPPPPPLAP